MPVERSVGGVVFFEEKGTIFYLLLCYPALSHRAKKDYWDFPKGHVEKGEDEIQTLKREIFEETGLQEKEIEIVENFKETIKYFFKFKNENILKFVTFYLVRAKSKNVKISSEHKDFAWLPFKKAFSKITFQNSKEVLRKANEFLKKLTQ